MNHQPTISFPPFCKGFHPARRMVCLSSAAMVVVLLAAVPAAEPGYHIPDDHTLVHHKPTLGVALITHRQPVNKLDL